MRVKKRKVLLPVSLALTIIYACNRDQKIPLHRDEIRRCCVKPPSRGNMLMMNAALSADSTENGQPSN